jgi:hypothetical protein
MAVDSHSKLIQDVDSSLYQKFQLTTFTKNSSKKIPWRMSTRSAYCSEDRDVEFLAVRGV